MTHAGKIVTVICESNSFRLVIDGETVRTVPRTTSREIDRYKAHATHPQKAVNSMPGVKLDDADAAELAEMLQFLTGWLARDPSRLGTSLAEFVGHPAYGITQLRDDLERFVFLLGGSDGEPLFWAMIGGQRHLRAPAYRLSQVTGPKLAGATGGGLSLRPRSIPRKVLALITNDE
jgi:hypothetical protein